MKKLLIVALTLSGVFAVSALAQDQVPTRKAAPGQEQKAQRKALIEKYDADKNGRLKKAEVEKMTAEDLAQWNSIAEANKAKAAEAKAKAAEKKDAEGKKAAGQANKPDKKDK